MEQVRGARVVPSLFAILGVAPLLGRHFVETEGVDGGPRVAILSHGLWKSRYGSDRGVIGRSISLNGERFEVVGVMPPGFAFPRGAELMRGLAFGPRTDVWVPLRFSAQELANYGTQNLAAVGRLRDGVTTAMAHDDVGSIVSQLLKGAGVTMAIGNQIVTLKDQAAKPVERGLWLLLAAVIAVLLIACANVAGLLSARVAERQREFAVRLALGARQPRLAQQLLTETFVLALVGGALGTLLTYWGTRLLLGLAPADLPRSDDVGFGWAVVAAIGVVSLLCGLAFGFIALGGLTAAAPAQALSAGSQRATANRWARMGRRILVAGQVALSLLLLIGAGLLLRSFVRIQEVRPGFAAHGAVAGEIILPVPGQFDPVQDGPAWVRFFDQYLTQVGQLPGVVAAGAVSGLPLTGSSEGSSFAAVGKEPARREDWPSTTYLIAAGDYFHAAGIEVLAGRSFDRSDRSDTRRVAVISKAFAARAFPGVAPIGQLVRFGFEFDPNASPREVIGVVDDVKHGSLDAGTEATVYVPQSQMSYPGLSVVVRTSGAPEAIVAALRRELRQINSAVALSNVRTLETVLATSLGRQRFMLTLLGAFAGAALLLAVLGLYGVIAITVQARRRELGVRLALGAKPRSLVWLVVADGMRVVAVGAVVGLLAAAAVGGTLRGLLFEVGTRDLAVYLGATAIVGVVALTATYLPARSAVRGNPSEALLPD